MCDELIKSEPSSRTTGGLSPLHISKWHWLLLWPACLWYNTNISPQNICQSNTIFSDLLGCVLNDITQQRTHVNKHTRHCFNWATFVEMSALANNVPCPLSNISVSLSAIEFKAKDIPRENKKCCSSSCCVLHWRVHWKKLTSRRCCSRTTILVWSHVTRMSEISSTHTIPIPTV